MGEASEYNSLMKLMKDHATCFWTSPCRAERHRCAQGRFASSTRRRRCWIPSMSLASTRSRAPEDRRRRLSPATARRERPVRRRSKASRGKVHHPKVAEMFATHLVTDTEGRAESLSDREFQTMRLDRVRQALSQIMTNSRCHRRRCRSIAPACPEMHEEQRGNHPLRDQARPRQIGLDGRSAPRTAGCRTMRRVSPGATMATTVLPQPRGTDAKMRDIAMPRPWLSKAHPG